MRLILNNHKREIIIGFAITILAVLLIKSNLLIWLANVVDKHEGSTVAIITILGWFLAYGFTIKAQNKNYLNQVRNEARLKINNEIHKCSEWFGRIYFIILNDITPMINAELYEESKLLMSISKYENIINEELGQNGNNSWNSQKWNYLLREYEVLFVETKKIRIEMLRFQEEVRCFCQLMLKKLKSEDIKERIEAISKLIYYGEFIIYYINVLGELRLHLQNRCFSHLTNKNVDSLRKDESLPKIVMGKDNYLIIDNLKSNKYEEWVKELTDYSDFLRQLRDYKVG